jgi:hypothetical protein
VNDGSRLALVSVQFGHQTIGKLNMSGTAHLRQTVLSMPLSRRCSLIGRTAKMNDLCRSGAVGQRSGRALARPTLDHGDAAAEGATNQCVAIASTAKLARSNASAFCRDSTFVYQSFIFLLYILYPLFYVARYITQHAARQSRLYVAR